MKKFLLTFFSAFCLFIIFFGATEDASAFTHRTGDILITKDTSGLKPNRGITGHAAIVIDNGTRVLDIAGPNSYPRTMSINEWYRDFSSTKVVRHNNQTLSRNAGDWAKRYYVNDPNHKWTQYRVTPNPKDRTYTYCSEIVWQGYFYGGGLEIKTPHQGGIVNPVNWATPAVIAPYDFTIASVLRHNGFSTVRTVGW